jgi:hypothetical protein
MGTLSSYFTRRLHARLQESQSLVQVLQILHDGLFVSQGLR